MKMNFKLLFKFRLNAFVLILIAVFVVVNSVLLFARFPLPGNAVYIAPGSNSSQIADLLENRGIIKSRLLFIIAGELFKIFKNLKAGEYSFGKAASTIDVVRKISSGEINRHKVTVPEGCTVAEIARILKVKGLVDEAKFIAMAENANFTVDTFSFPAKLEGYLFPETYEFTKMQNTEEFIIREMLQEFKKRVVDVYSEEMKKKGISLDKLINIASLVEEEAIANSERSLIARVFYNRLKLGMKLQCDPTVRYALGKFSGKLTREDLKAKSPFNTYTTMGLPPRPICNPGTASIEAALRPADSKYLYFVSKNDGTHFFASNYREHRKAQVKYQLN